MARLRTSGASVADPVRHQNPLVRLRSFLTNERLNSGRFLLLCWFAVRLIVFLIWGLAAPSTQGDVYYYYDRIAAMFQVGPAATMQEYPTPALLVLLIPYALGFGTATGYVAAFVGLLLALDAGFAYTLWRCGGRMRGQAVLCWTLFLGFIGPTVYLRFDLVTAVLAGWALILVLRRHPIAGGALIGLGAAVKLWPALLWPALCGAKRKHNLQVSAGVFGVGGALAAFSLVWAGWDRLLSPLTYQSDRGLQVESIWASFPMLLRGLGLGDYAVAISRYQAFEIWGTGVQFWSRVADLAAVAGYVLILVIYLVWMLRGNGRLMEAAALMLLVVTTLIVTNKTFSPQYVMWLGGALAAAFAIMGARAPWNPFYNADRRRLKRITIVILALALLTTVVYPIGYGPLVRDLTSWWAWLRLPVTLVLVLRNALVVWLFVDLVRWVWSFLNPSAFREIRANPPAAADTFAVSSLTPAPDSGDRE